MIFKNGNSTPLNQLSGDVPNMADALTNWFHKLTFGVVTETVVNAQVVQTKVDISFQGVIQPFTDRQLLLKPEGQRAWSWYQVHAEVALNLAVDGVIEYRGNQYRVMSKRNYSDYGYVEYHLQTDYTGAGPATVTP